MLKKQRAAMKLRLKERLDGPIVPLGDDFVVNLERARALREVRRQPQGRQGHEARFRRRPEHGRATRRSRIRRQIRDIVIADTSALQRATQLASTERQEQAQAADHDDVASKTNTVALDVYFTGFAIQ